MKKTIFWAFLLLTLVSLATAQTNRTPISTLSTTGATAGKAITYNGSAVVWGNPNVPAASISDSTAAGRALLMAANATAQTALLDTATSSLKGLQSATDKAKLDKMETTAVTIAATNPVTDIASVGSQFVNLSGVGVSILGFGTAPEGTVRLIRKIGVGTITLTVVGTGITGTVTMSTDDTATVISTGTGWMLHDLTRATGSARRPYPGFSGDVTGAADSATLTIANSVVTNAKLANMAANSVKCNNTASSAVPIDCTTAQLKAFLALGAADISSGTLSQTVGGTGAGALTCAADQALTSNGTAYSCANVTASATPAGASGAVQYNNAGATGGASKTTITSNGTLNLTEDAAPVTPAAGNLNVYSRNVAQRMMLTQKGPSGLEAEMQPLMARNKIGYWAPPGNGTTVPGVFGLTAPTVVGTATARNVATTSLATRMRRLGYVSAATAAAMAEARIAAAQFSAGSGSNDGSGFFYVTRWVPSDAAAVSGERFFIGVGASTSAATNIEPNTVVNQIGVCQLSTDATQYFLCYGGSAAQTAIALGTNFPPAGLSAQAFELAIFAPPTTANTFYVQVTNLSSGAVFTQTLTGAATVVPQSTTLLAHKAWKSNNATALAVGFDICSIYFETDN